MQYTNSRAGFWRRYWTLNLTQCYNCGFAFNFWHGKRPSFAAKQNGPYWNFRCPNCNRKTAFDLRSSAFDRGQPTYADASRLFALFLQLPMGAALLTLIVFSYAHLGNWFGSSRLTLLFFIIEETVIAAVFLLNMAIVWHYTHGVNFERVA